MCYTQAPYQASAPHLKPFANDGRLLLGALKSAGYWSGKPTMVIMVTYPYISLPCFSILTCHASLICGWVKTSVSCQRVGGLGGRASTDPRTPSIFIQIYFIILCLLYVRIYIYYIYIHMVVSWNGATPIAGWFIVELPSIHGWELGWPILGNPHMTHMFVIYL